MKTILIKRSLIASCIVNIVLLYVVFDQKSHHDKLVETHTRQQKFMSDMHEIRDLEQYMLNARHLYNILNYDYSDSTIPMPEGANGLQIIKKQAQTEAQNMAIEIYSRTIELPEDSQVLSTIRSNVKTSYEDSEHFNRYAYIADQLKRFDKEYNHTHYASDYILKLHFPNQGMDPTLKTAF